MAWLVLISILLGLTAADVCKHPDGDSLGAAMVRRVAPRDKSHAGKYTQLDTATTANDCILGCCKEQHCNAAFFNKGICLLISCKTTQGCEPGQPSDELEDALLVNLRTVEETGPFVDTTTTQTTQVGKNQAAQVVVTKPCELGLLDECALNEVCSPKSGVEQRSMMGTCQCKDGFSRNLLTQICESIIVPIPVKKDSTTPGTPAPMPAEITEASDKNAADLNPTKAEVTSSPTTVIPEMQKLVVSAGEAKVLHFPDSAVTLSAFALPEPITGELYSYSWTLIKNPEGDNIGQMKGLNEKQLQLSQLIPGFYQFKVDVSGTNKQGSASVNVTVLPPERQNEAPLAIIKPSHLNVNEKTAAILDGGESTDDDSITTYLWEIASGPMSDGFQLNDDHTSMLTLKDLVPGEYSIRLTVTDSDGLKNSTTATVTVQEETDYPPNANAGDDAIVNLPKNLVTLYGNASTDDHGIVSYEWKAKGEALKADIAGVDKPVLHLTNLREGDYTLELEVTDTKGQKDTAEVHVFVKASENIPPVAILLKNVTTALPDRPVVLDGSKSTDENVETMTYLWEQVSGPSSATLVNADRETATTSNLKIGDYIFKLTVTDAQGLKSMVEMKVLVRDHENSAPVAAAGNDQSLSLPVWMLKLNGNLSTDDNKIISYKWAKHEDSPGAGEILAGTDESMMLQMVDLVAGVYTFTLVVTDEEGLTGSDDVTVTVVSSPHSLDLMELSLDAPIETFTEKNRNEVATQLELLLPSESGSSTKVVIQGVQQDYHSGKLVILFLVHDHTSDEEFTVRNGTKVRAQLNERMSKGSNFLSFKFAQVDTVVCQNDCSGHGRCDQYTKTCICEAFWMPNYANVQLKGESNCEWSILYVVIGAFGIILVLIFFTWFCVCCSRRCKGRKSNRRKHTYKLLEDIDEMERDEKLSKRNNISKGKGSIFLSETDFSSEEDTLFSSGRKSNGVSQSLLKKPNDLVKANNLRNQKA